MILGDSTVKSITGPWVSGEDFFDRDRELQVLDRHIRNGNPILLSGQRRMGKTSVARELGRRLEQEGWAFAFADVEHAASPEDVITKVAEALHPVRGIASRLGERLARLFSDNVEQLSAYDFGIKFRAGLNAGAWPRHGESIIRSCAEHEQSILLVIDELPIFLNRLLRQDDGRALVDEFLSWLRGAIQDVSGGSLALMLSGSIGLTPLVRRLGLTDRTNYLYEFRLGPWDRSTSVECFNQLARTNALSVEDGVAEAAYDALGVGIPHHVQSFFARLLDFATMHSRDAIKVVDVETVYQTDLLGPFGQNDLMHYEARLRDALGENEFAIANAILAEAAVQGQFTPSARKALEALFATKIENISERVADILEVLIHDGYLEADDGSHRFVSRLLKDWWATRYADHHPTLSSDHSVGRANR
ncbi:MAG: ATP-binding protein [Gammaproteobacteria bacterium]|nr:ATP-binding protein [Gammaproteobacteria bacterium]MYK84084.1 ATP-binding protein [Gammaproteobacteria bacterium]